MGLALCRSATPNRHTLGGVGAINLLDKDAHSHTTHRRQRPYHSFQRDELTIIVAASLLVHQPLLAMAPVPHTTPVKGTSKPETDGGTVTANSTTAPTGSGDDGIPAQPAGFIYGIPKRQRAAYPHPIVSHAHGVTTAWWLLSVLLTASLVTNALQLLSHALLFLPRPTRLAFAQQLADVFWLLFPFATEVHSSIPLLLTRRLSSVH